MEINFTNNNYNISLEFKELILLRETLEELIPFSTKFESHMLTNELIVKLDNCLFEVAKENLTHER